VICTKIAQSCGVPEQEIFQYLMTAHSQPNEIFGPFSLAALERDLLTRRTHGCVAAIHRLALPRARA
jgi:hypothetical protein